MKSEHEMMMLSELVAAAAVALSKAELTQPSGRVREVPSIRTVRYYAAYGLLDRPLGWRGRTALYGERHLLQLLAIKQLQAYGLGLDVIQSRLLGVSDAELRRIAKRSALKCDDGCDDGLDDVRHVGHVQKRASWWFEEPALVELSESEQVFDSTPTSASYGVQSTSRVSSGGVVGRLSPDLLLLIEGALRALDDEDVVALNAAAQPLMHVLRARHIL